VRRVAELREVCALLKAAPEESRLKALTPASFELTDPLVLEMELLLVEDAAEEGGAAVEGAQVDGLEAPEDLDYARFWDASGAAVETEVAASLLTLCEMELLVVEDSAEGETALEGAHGGCTAEDVEVAASLSTQ
jgi:hypothetical protein